MQQIDKNTFFEFTKNFAFVPVTQTQGMYEMHALSGVERIKFFVNDIKKPTIACFGHEKKFLTKKMLLINGECFAEKIDFKNRKKTQQYISDLQVFYVSLKTFDYDMIEIQSNTEWNFNYEIALRQAGYLRPVGLFSTTVTRLVNLALPIEYDRNWERNIKKSAKYNLKLEIIEQPSEKDCADFCAIYNTMCDRKFLRTHLTMQQVFRLCNDNAFRLLFVNDGELRIATLIIYIDKKEMTSEGVFAGSIKTALEKHASFFMYDAMFQYLNSFCVVYDMAKLTASEKGKLFQFKNGITGKAIHLNGEYSLYKKRYYRPMMYFVKKYLMKKREV